MDEAVGFADCTYFAAERDWALGGHQVEAASCDRIGLYAMLSALTTPRGYVKA